MSPGPPLGGAVRAGERDAQAAISFEPGSFRDPDSRIVLADGEVYRALSQRGLEDWRALAGSQTFERFTTEGTLVRTEEREAAEVPSSALYTGVAGVLRHERIPFVSYPYEWTFGMLRDAALLELDLLLSSLDDDLVLKDASPYNVQWRGAQPVFVDVGSFERLREGEPWAGYRQFCCLFLYPLLIQAYRGAPFHPWLRGSIDGITPAEADSLFSLRDHLRRGVLTHVHLHARLERSAAKRAGSEVKAELRRARFSSELIRANAKRLRKLVARLRWRPPSTAWTGYREQNTYDAADAQSKLEIVEAAADALRPATVWDLGCNDGVYSRAVADRGARVVAVDSDHATVDALYGELKAAGDDRILPLVMNLADPSPGLGWAGAERAPLGDRGKPDLVLCLALVHHLAIGANIPVAEIVGWLHRLGAALVIEFPAREDPMVESLLSGKRAGSNPDYVQEHFERCLGELFEIEARETLPSRTLYRARPRPRP